VPPPPFYIHSYISDELKEKLDEASEEDLEAFKARYGKQLVENLINESASYAWVDEYAKHCPVCKAAITVCFS